ncbi:hypothetical protein J0J24_23075, partial [Vibrio vulnificus]|nr:hypothetical protein [Vibrio vulnificus]
AELSLSNVTDADVLPNLVKQTRRRIGAYDISDCNDSIQLKRAVPIIPQREGLTSGRMTTIETEQ